MNNQNPNKNGDFKPDTSINRKKRKAYLDDRKGKALKVNRLTNITNRLQPSTTKYAPSVPLFSNPPIPSTLLQNTCTSSCITGSNVNAQPKVILSSSTSSKSTFGSNVPIVDVEDSIENLIAEVQKGFGISKDYFDHGDPIHVCLSCGAMLWEEEMLRGNRDRKKRSFSLCCKNGQVQLPQASCPPPTLERLFKSACSKGTNFKNNIRAYNMMFSFTSMGGKIDKSLQNGRGPFVFRLQGQNYHQIGSLLPADGAPPKFSQLYIYDSENEVQNRINALTSGSKRSNVSTNNSLDTTIIASLQKLLDDYNPLVKSFRMVRDCLKGNELQNVTLKLISNRATDGRVYNLPTASEVAGLIVGDVDQLVENRDIILRTKTGGLQRISQLHPSYLPLQYPLLFPYGEDGFRLGIKHHGIPDDSDKPRSRLTMREWFCYRLQDRKNEYSLILHSKKLFHQFLVDGYTMVESDRLSWIKREQKKLRTDTFQNLNDNIVRGNNSASESGKRVLLPSSFTGGSRYMMQKYLDAMAICKSVGYPDLFITVTCNPNWPEIHRWLSPKDLRPEDRPDLLTRIFKIKLDHLLNDFTKGEVFGPLQAVIYTVEFQKRGLPHAHICLFLSAGYKLPTASDVDRVISAEIPNENNDPELYNLVKQFMVHGPCGADDPTCTCMVKNKCSKKFPKKFQSETVVDNEGYPVYRRRDTGNIIEKNGIELNNQYVVPYNPSLLKKYQCHMNVEWCNQSGSIKYLFKYINKGPDRVTASIYQNPTTQNENQRTKNVDEVQSYLDCRYVSACEASWRIFGYDIHYRWPPVETLPFHEKDKQCVVYDDDANLCDVVSNPTVKRSMFIQWMEQNKKDEFARTLKYVDFPKYYIWERKGKKWSKRTLPSSCIGRLQYVPISFGETYYLRVLLNHVKGPTCWDDIKTVNGKVFSTYKEACQELGFLNDDKEYVEAIKEANNWAPGSYLRRLFVALLLSNSVTRPQELWSKTWKMLSEDIEHRQRQIMNMPGLTVGEQEIQNICLSYIDELLRLNGSSLNNFPDMPSIDKEYVSSLNNRLIRQELIFDKILLQKEHIQNLRSLTEEQRDVYETVMKSVDKDDGGLFFVYGYGGTGKTFLWKTLTTALRCKGEIVLNVASSGIAALLLSGGRTAHSRFIIPINIFENSVCSIDPNSELAELIKKNKIDHLGRSTNDTQTLFRGFRPDLERHLTENKT